VCFLVMGEGGGGFFFFQISVGGGWEPSVTHFSFQLVFQLLKP